MIELYYKQTFKRKIRGLGELARREAFNAINYVPFQRVHPNLRGPKNNKLNKCLQLLEVRAWERKGDCSFRNEELAKLLQVSKRQITNYIKQLEEQGFINVLYCDNIKEVPIIQRDPITMEPILGFDSKPMILRVNKKRLTYRIIRCHRIIAKNGYKVPAAKVSPDSRKNKPFRFDFRPPLESISFDKIPSSVFDYSRLFAPDVIQSNSLIRMGKENDLRIKALQHCYNINIGIEEGERRGLIPKISPVADFDAPSTFANLYEQYANEGTSDHPLVYDLEVRSMYNYFKIKAEEGDKIGLSVLGEQYYTNPDLDALPDAKVPYFTTEKLPAYYVSLTDPLWRFKPTNDAARYWARKENRNSDKIMVSI